MAVHSRASNAVRRGALTIRGCGQRKPRAAVSEPARQAHPVPPPGGLSSLLARDADSGSFIGRFRIVLATASSGRSGMELRVPRVRLAAELRTACPRPAHKPPLSAFKNQRVFKARCGSSFYGRDGLGNITVRAVFFLSSVTLTVQRRKSGTQFENAESIITRSASFTALKCAAERSTSSQPISSRKSSSAADKWK